MGGPYVEYESFGRVAKWASRCAIARTATAALDEKMLQTVQAVVDQKQSFDQNYRYMPPGKHHYGAQYLWEQVIYLSAHQLHIVEGRCDL